MRWTQTITERFWSKVNKRGPRAPHMKTRCWVWTSTLNRDGYGHFFIQAQVAKDLGFNFTHKTPQVRAHALAYVWKHGPVPSGKELMHVCDNRACVRHVRPATHKENIRDAVMKNRMPRKVTEKGVAVMRKLFHSGVHQKMIAKRFGVVQQTVSRVLRSM